MPRRRRKILRAGFSFSRKGEFYMSVIKVENLTFSYDTSYDKIFDNVSFQIDTNWKLGFVGRNGRGKTTFLNLLLGRYEYQGRILSSVQFDYFPYEVKDKNVRTEEVLREVCPVAETWEFMRELSYLSMEAEVLEKPFGLLSQGEQTKALLAALFLNEGHFLLIDEPTNHLDMGARELVSAYLKRKRGFILVSHDRAFLDGCTNHILSLNKTDIEVQSGNFSSWLENFENRQKFEEAENVRLQKDIRRLEKAAERTSGWSDKTEASKYRNGPIDRGYVGHKAAKMMKRSKIIETRTQKAIEEKSKLLKNKERAENLKLFPFEYTQDTLASFSEIVIYYDEKPVCHPMSFHIRKGDRIVLEGKNGSGKSSILKLLAGESKTYTGIVDRGTNLRISYVPQDTSWLRGSLSAFAVKNQIEESLLKALLRKLDFDRVQFEKDMSEFSSGQKKKVLLAKSLCEKAHLYVWDEPLNFVDLYSRMQIEALIREYKPTMVLVEHDKAFREEIGTKHILIEKERE